MKKKILSVLLSLCLLIGLFPAVALANGDNEGSQTPAQAEDTLSQREIYPADKSILMDLVGKATDLDVTGYTPESVDAFYAALEHACEILNTPLTFNEQHIVDNAVVQLVDAMDGLVAIPEDKVVVIVAGDKVEATVGEVTIVMENAGAAFEVNTAITVEHITWGEIYDRVEEALKDLNIDMEDVSVFEFGAAWNGAAVQPNVPVMVTFQIPKGMDPDEVKLYYVSESGHREEIPIVVDKESNTATAYLTHFSTYVLVEVKPDETPDKTQLQWLMDQATDMVEHQELYVPTHWDALLTALDAAQSVYEDPAATEQEVEEAAQALLQAILVQRFKADKSILEDLVNQALAVDLTGCTQQQAEAFRGALAQAQAVLADDTLSTDDQAVVDAAVAALSAALEDVTADTQPEASDKPEASKDPEATQQPESVPPTGDHAPLMAYLGILTLSAAALLILAQNKRKA